MKIAYTVSCTFTDPDVARRWMDWLRNGHLADVVDAGAESAYAVHLDGRPVRCEARFTFASRADYDAYQRDQAPRLREEGLSLFPLDLGLEYSRSVGEVLEPR
ncbi:MAG: DUF4286 family protein [Acidobacteriota bacterium]